MANELHFCIYYGTGANKPTSNTKTTTTNDPSAVVYQSFLKDVSNDIERYQALQRVVCGHDACKAALLKSMQTAKAG